MAVSALDTCIVHGIHPEAIQQARSHLPGSDALAALADLFKLFADPSRISILWALSEAELCVCDLCALLGMKQSAMSHQLRNLKQARIVKTRRDGKMVFYSLDDEHIRQLLNLGTEHLNER